MTVKHRVEGENVCEKDIASQRLQEHLLELQNRVKLFNEQFRRAKDVFEETQEDLKRFQSRADRQCEIARMKSEIQGQILGKLAEMERMVNLRTVREHNVTPPRDEVMPDAAKAAMRCSIAHIIGRYVKIGCIILLDSTASYALFKITKPFFF